MDSEGTCRFCFCSAPLNKLISPCVCEGSMKYVHSKCLERWMSAGFQRHVEQLGESNFYVYPCEVCKAGIKFERRRSINFFKSLAKITRKCLFSFRHFIKFSFHCALLAFVCLRTDNTVRSIMLVFKQKAIFSTYLDLYHNLVVFISFYLLSSDIKKYYTRLILNSKTSELRFLNSIE